MDQKVLDRAVEAGVKAGYREGLEAARAVVESRSPNCEPNFHVNASKEAKAHFAGMKFQYSGILAAIAALEVCEAEGFGSARAKGSEEEG